jgi:hypothetical protein
MRRNQMRWQFIKEAEQGIYERYRHYSLRQASTKEMTGELVATKVFLTTDILPVTTEVTKYRHPSGWQVQPQWNTD